jgi:aryl-alcohol dehydrogenase-like predicted oxidoreductase
LKAIAAQAGRSMVSMSLNWLLHHTATDCVILGASRIDQLKNNVQDVKDGALDPATLQACNQVWQTLRGVTPSYNR